MSEEADNVVLRHLRELRAHMDGRFGELRIHIDQRFGEHEERFVKIEARLADLTGVMHDTRRDVQALAHRLDEVEAGFHAAERMAAVEERLAELERRQRGS